VPAVLDDSFPWVGSLCPAGSWESRDWIEVVFKLEDFSADGVGTRGDFDSHLAPSECFEASVQSHG